MSLRAARPILRQALARPLRATRSYATRTAVSRRTGNYYAAAIGTSIAVRFAPLVFPSHNMTKDPPHPQLALIAQTWTPIALDAQPAAGEDDEGTLQPSGQKLIPMSEVALHNTRDDCWVVIEVCAMFSCQKNGNSS